MIEVLPIRHMDLSAPPEIVLLTQANHGLQLREQYFVDSWALHFYHYHADLEVDGQWTRIAPRHIGVTPPRVHLTYVYPGPGCRHLVALFHLANGQESLRAAPAMQPGGLQFDALHEALSEVVHLRQTQPTWAAARLWDVLHGVADLAARPDPQRDLVRLATAYIDRHLHESLRVGDVADRFRVSRNHLTRRFQAELSCTVIAYIQQLRLDRALDLLRHSDTPIRYIAPSLGYPDLQRFNKFIRTQTGRSPSRHRQHDVY